MTAEDQIGANIEGGPWLSITALAELKGVSKPTISEKVSRLEREEGLRTRHGAGGTKLVNLAEYDRLLNETSDLGKLQAAATVRARREEETSDEPSKPAAATEATFSEVQKKKIEYEAALKALEYGERSRQLVATTEVQAVIEKIVGASLGAIDALILLADEIAAASAKDGIAGVRQVLKAAVHKTKMAIAAAWRELEAISKERDGGGVAVDLELPEEEQQ